MTITNPCPPTLTVDDFTTRLAATSRPLNVITYGFTVFDECLLEDTALLAALMDNDLAAGNLIALSGLMVTEDTSGFEEGREAWFVSVRAAAGPTPTGGMDCCEDELLCTDCYDTLPWLDRAWARVRSWVRSWGSGS